MLGSVLSVIYVKDMKLKLSLSPVPLLRLDECASHVRCPNPKEGSLQMWMPIGCGLALLQRLH